MGLALVRNLDAASGTLFISTPVPLEQLHGVSVLARTSLELPLSLLQPTVLTDPSPYLYDDCLKGVGGQQQRSRNNIVRGPTGPKMPRQ